jgi:phosphinothricin acetyltransferase
VLGGVKMNHLIRLATVTDSKDILKVYAPYITDTAVSFETEVPTVSEFACRIESINKKYPYIVYQIEDKIVGYAYASKHRERAAYCFDVDVSIYVLPEYHGSGVAHKLYDCLFKILVKLGYYNAYAGYTVPNQKSMKFHQKFGFTLVGTYHKTGYKFGQWHDVTWLEKALNNHNNKPESLKSINDLPEEYLYDIFHSYTKL